MQLQDLYQRQALKESKLRANEKKAKAGSKKKKAEALSSDTDGDGDGNGGDANDLDPQQMPEYRQTMLALQCIWLCNQHPGSLCLFRRLKVHKIVAFDAEIAWVLAIVRLSVTFYSLFIHCIARITKFPG